MDGKGITTRSQTQKYAGPESMEGMEAVTAEAVFSAAQVPASVVNQNHDHPSQAQFDDLQRQVQTLIDLMGSRLPDSVPAVDIDQHETLLPKPGNLPDTKPVASATAHLVPQPYDGTVSWTAYRAQFQAVADQHRWNNQERATQLIACLRGPALEVLGHLSQGVSADFGMLSEALHQRFGSPHQEELFLAQFRDRIRQQKETLSEVAYDVKRLGTLAYPGAPAEFLDRLIRDQFVEALNDPDMQIPVMQTNPATLHDALTCAQRIEALKKSYGRKGTPFSGNTGFKVRTAVADAGGQTPTLDAISERLGRLEQSVAAGISRQTRAGPPAAAAQRNPGTLCWHCGKPGHIQRNCMQRQKISSPVHHYGPNDATQSGN